MKVTRAGAQHSLKELEVSVMLRGDFDASYTRADNRLVVPNDEPHGQIEGLVSRH